MTDPTVLFIILRELHNKRFMSKQQRTQQIHHDQAAVTNQGWRAGNILRFFKLRIKLDPANGYDFTGPSPSEPSAALEPSARFTQTKVDMLIDGTEPRRTTDGTTDDVTETYNANESVYLCLTARLPGFELCDFLGRHIRETVVCFDSDFDNVQEAVQDLRYQNTKEAVDKPNSRYIGRPEVTVIRKPRRRLDSPVDFETLHPEPRSASKRHCTISVTSAATSDRATTEEPSTAPTPPSKRSKRTPKKNNAQSPLSSSLSAPANDEDLETFEDLRIADTLFTTLKALKKKALAKKAASKTTPAVKKPVLGKKATTETSAIKTPPTKAPPLRRSARK
ncbi:hypothetical protein AJ78_08266 [Emergomyces pasteurianus Ep9510]|uniref:Uncharacterized protein n=1 Tax=Emergomyces pasteurianus Ep9510 TaxID=1447872 RepID=A0A1J9P3X0_9EURO|nr:hypothetical protein AJ78_08266 [Emergomyces pasteurianus Ep9510]